MLKAIELKSSDSVLQNLLLMKDYTPKTQEASMPMEIDSSVRLFKLFLSGDDLAFTSLYAIYNQKLFIYCTKILQNEEEAKDIIQMVWEKIIRLRNGKNDIKNPIGFLFKIARNLCLDHKKHASFQLSIDSMEEHNLFLSPKSQYSLTENEELVIEALEDLPFEAKEIIVLHYYNGYSFQEIAAIQGKSSNAVWMRVSRARKLLREIIEKRIRKEELR
jgi:RNA polymerase sigma factor (sigma-70 family)